MAQSLTGENAYPFLYTMMANVTENNTLQKLGANPQTTIFDHLLTKQAVYSYFPKRKISADTLRKFLEAIKNDRVREILYRKAPKEDEHRRDRARSVIHY